ncbi:hypothetical protein MKK75_03055 [Methylobacterium sp. J-030]|uniref:hypothetical protein n=1 Tax=Methylobacterium sp. J-030 TaxID=2836627 RepID=UPI001FB9721E|nr:hypothetical protein [Methylobacterium sp. J-030]MCJ2067794.1 hypothetical protein [Methylobacterium sp. J-030]
MSTPAIPVLMSKDNPDGWKLELLLPQLCQELADKNARLAGDPSATAILVRANNVRILDLLLEAERLQRDTQARLTELGPDRGPSGRPRIGAGSAGSQA